MRLEHKNVEQPDCIQVDQDYIQVDQDYIQDRPAFEQDYMVVAAAAVVFDRQKLD